MLFRFGNGKVAVETSPVPVEDILLFSFASVYKVCLHSPTLNGIGAKTHTVFNFGFKCRFLYPVLIPCIDCQQHFKQQKKDQKALYKRLGFIGLQSYTPVPGYF